MTTDFIKQMLRADACWKDIALRHVFSDLNAPDGRGLDSSRSEDLFDELIKLDDAGVNSLFDDGKWEWCLQNRYEDMSPRQAVDAVINMVHMLDSTSRHLLAQKSNFVGVDLWLRDDIQFPRLLSEIVATQDKLDIPCLAESMDLTIDEVGELFDRAQGAWATHLQESLETQKKTGKSSFNAWCRQADGRGTTWLSAVRASSLDEAVSEARLACASDWGWQGREDEILVVGIQPGGQMSEVVWDDDGLHESTVDEDGMAEGDQP